MKLLEEHRREIDLIDDQIIDLLTKRMGVIHTVGALKKEHNLPAVLPDRVEEVIERCAERAQSQGLDPSLVRCLYTVLIDHACDTEERIIQNT